MATVAGIDSDNDGVRDDVQRYIALAYPSSAKTRAALTQITKVMQSVLIDASSQQNSLANMLDLSHALECSIYIHGSAAGGLALDLVTQFVNTQDRATAYSLAQFQFGGQLYKFNSPTQQKAFCAFNLAALHN